MHKVKADPKAKLQKLTHYWEGLTPDQRIKQYNAFKEHLSRAALDAMVDQFLELQKTSLEAGKLDGKKPLSRAEVTDVLTMLFAVKDDELRSGSAYANYLSSLGLQSEEVERFDFSTLELIGFKLQEMKRQSKKDAKMSRVTDEDCVEAVKKAGSRGLSERLISNDPLVNDSAQKEISELKGKITSVNMKNKCIHGTILTYAILGIALSVLGFFIAMPPGAMIALTVITLLLCIGMMATDGYFMVQGWNYGAPGLHDKKYLLIISSVILVALVVSVSVTLGLGLPLLPLILACVIGGVSLGLASIAYTMLILKEKKWIEDHPDLIKFQEILNAQLTYDDAAQVPDHESLYHSGCVKAPGLRPSARGVVLSSIQPPLPMAQPRELSRSPNDKDFRGQALDEKVTAVFKKLPKAARRAVREKYFEMSSQGELGFKTAKYRTLDSNRDFGSAYLFSQVQPESMSDANEYDLFVRGMKKTAKLFWQKWENAKTEENKRIAMEMQALFERVSRKNSQDVEERINSLMANQSAYLQLKRNLWYIAKRQESQADLKKAVDAVIAEEAANHLEINPLPERLVDAFN